MKFNVLRAILVPWILFFFAATGLFVLASLEFPVQTQDPRLRIAALEIGGVLCLLANLATLNRAGIWVADSLPYSVRRHPWSWVVRAGVAASVALIFYGMGQASWMPLYWQGFVIPIVFTVALFVVVRSLLGLTLKKAARVSFIRLFTLVMNVPLLFIVAVTALFLSQNIVTSYEASQPEVTPSSLAPLPIAEKSLVALADDEETKPPVPVTKRGQEFKAAAEKNQNCSEQNTEIRTGLDPKAGEDVAYWAVKAVKCTDMKSVTILPRLSELMIKHKSSQVRAAAISMMLKYNHESVKPVSYLLVKRLNEHETKEVLEAAASVLSKLGEEEKASATNRLKLLLDSPAANRASAEILIRQLHRPELVSAYVSQNLNGSSDTRARAISLICLLPEAERAVAAPFISDITGTIKQGSAHDPAMEALACMGAVGLQAIREEVQNPRRLARPLAAQALAEMDLKNDKESLKTVEACLRDENQEVRKWCSQSMGKIGKIALPQILDLLKSKDPQQLESGHRALEFFDDPEAREDLRRVRAENSGWMANKKKLQVANAVSSALLRIENQSHQ